jgi:hypothetical protein
MQLAYRHALTAFDNITDVTVIWDYLYDRSCPAMPFKADVITHSSLDFLSTEQHGWLRQQYVKLNLHKLFNEDSWIVLDADVILKTKKSFDCKEIYTDSEDHYEPYFKFIKYAFNLDKNDSPSYMTHFAQIERRVLVSIEEFILNKHGKDLISVYKEYPDISPPACPGFSEFEIYGLFVERILQEKIALPEYQIENYLADNFIKHYHDNYDLLLEGDDAGVPVEFWQAEKIKFQ